MLERPRMPEIHGPDMAGWMLECEGRRWVQFVRAEVQANGTRHTKKTGKERLGKIVRDIERIRGAAAAKALSESIARALAREDERAERAKADALERIATLRKEAAND